MGESLNSPDRLENRNQRSRYFILAFAVLAAGLAYAFIVVNGSNELWSGFTFIMLLPMLIGAFLSLATPIEYRNHFRSLFSIQFYLFGVLILVFALIMREGVICILMLALPWLVFGMIGSWLSFLVRRRIRVRGRFLSASILILPIMSLQIETQLDPPETLYRVERSVVITATPADIWPSLLSIDNIQAGEGKWNFTQDLVGVPRPTSAVLEGTGLGATRHAAWGKNIRFKEHITAWQSDEELQWRFHFDDDSISRYTDRHIAPNSDLLRIETGGYRLELIDANASRLTLYTDYRTQSWMHLYASLWGEIYLGDIQENILALIKNRQDQL